MMLDMIKLSCPDVNPVLCQQEKLLGIAVEIVGINLYQTFS